MNSKDFDKTSSLINKLTTAQASVILNQLLLGHGITIYSAKERLSKPALSVLLINDEIQINC